MPTYHAHWGQYAVRYDTEGGDRTLVVRFPDDHELRGPAGTLTGLLDIVGKVLAAIEKRSEEQIVGSYRWPPDGFFFSETRRLKKDSPFGRFLKKDWDDPEQTWVATVYWTRHQQEWYSPASMGLRLWKALAPALESLMQHEDVRQLEGQAAGPVGVR